MPVIDAELNIRFEAMEFQRMECVTNNPLNPVAESLIWVTSVRDSKHPQFQLRHFRQHAAIPLRLKHEIDFNVFNIRHLLQAACDFSA